MNVLMQGYVEVPNFGDTLFAYLFYERCKKIGLEDVDFLQFKFGICDAVREEIGYYNKKHYLKCLKADAYIMLPGNPLWGGGSGRFGYWTRRRYFRYIFTPRLFQLMHKPVYILGAGGGPVMSPWLRAQMIKFLEHAELVYFRDKVTKSTFVDYGVKKEMTVTADAALVVTADILPIFEEHDSLEKMCNGRKKMLLHIPDKEGVKELREIVLPGLLDFLKENQDYVVVISDDNIHELNDYEKDTLKTVREQISEIGIDIYNYQYHSSIQMCSLINEVDCIITLKLHVGIVGVALGKSVIAFPYHREKVDSFFEMIGEPERCVNVRTLNSDIVYRQINKYCEIPVHLRKEIRDVAEKNLSALEIVKNYKKAN